MERTRPWVARLRERRAEQWVAAILLLLGWYKITYSLAKNTFSIDGGYYTTIALFVRDGLGLKTNVSLYHQAYSYFPHETSVSPLWPLLYGYVSKIFPLYSVAIWLPTLLYFTALIAGYLWGSRLLPRDLFPRSLPGFNAGHIVMLIFGLHEGFFIATSTPYTEGLSYTLLFLALWRFHACLREMTPVRALEVGVWLGVLLLARAQLALVAIAVVLALGFRLVTRPSRQSAIAMVVTPAVFLAIVGSYYFFFLRDFVGNDAVAAIMRFDQGWETDVLSKFAPMKETDGLAHYVEDRFGGVKIAFKEEGRYAYARVFYLFQWAIPAAFLALIAHALRDLRVASTRRAVTWLRSDEAAPWVFAVLLGLGGWTSMHLIHKDYFSEWHFARRQGLTAGLGFFLALAYLLHRPRLARAVGVFILCGSVYLGWNAALEPAREAAAKSKPYDPEDRHTALVKWLKQEDERREGGLVVALSAQEPQQIGYLTPEVGYHWVYKRTTLEDIDTLTQELGVDYVIFRNPRSWRFSRDPQFAKRYALVKRASGFMIYAPR